MNFTQTRQEGSVHEFEVTVAAAEVEQRVNARLKEVSRSVSVPGFRPGRAPMAVVKSKVLASVHEEVVKALMKETSAQVLAENDLGDVEDPELEAVTIELGQDLVYRLVATVK